MLRLRLSVISFLYFSALCIAVSFLACGEGSNGFAGDNENVDHDHELTGPGSWVARAPLPTPRSSLATVVTHGRIYAMGGFNHLLSPEAPLDVVEIYDPENDSWIEGVPLPEPRGAATACMIDGRIYVAGGYQWNADTHWFTARLDMFDPETDLWSQLPSMPTPRSLAAGAVLDGRFYLIAGRNNEGKAFQALDVVEVFDPVSTTWTVMNPLPSAMEAPAAQSIGDTILLAGGWDGTLGGYLNQSFVYDPANDSWIIGPSLSEPRCSLASTSLWDRYVFILGGYIDGWPPFRKAVDVFDLQTSTYTTTTIAPLPEGRGGPGAVTVDGRVFVIGGGDYDMPSHTAWYPRSNVWEFVPE